MLNMTQLSYLQAFKKNKNKNKIVDFNISDSNNKKLINKLKKLLKLRKTLKSKKLSKNRNLSKNNTIKKTQLFNF